MIFERHLAVGFRDHFFISLICHVENFEGAIQVSFKSFAFNLSFRLCLALSLELFSSLASILFLYIFKFAFFFVLLAVSFISGVEVSRLPLLDSLGEFRIFLFKCLISLTDLLNCLDTLFWSRPSHQDYLLLAKLSLSGL